MTTPHDKALAAFTDYFVRNYPGPDTVIFDPKWHAPKLFNAAMKAIEVAGGIVCEREPSAWAHRLNLELDQFITEFTGEHEHPFGKPGEDYSPEYTVTSTPLHTPIEAGNGGDGWLDIASAPKNQKVLVAYQNDLGNWRIVTACYHTQLEWSDEYGDHEQEYAPEDWYEENDSSDVIYPTSRKPTHWRPLPSPPSPSNEGEKQS